MGHTHKYSASSRFCDAVRLGGLHGGGGGGGLLGVLALVLAQSSQTALGATLQDGLAVLVHLQLDDHALWTWEGETVNIRPPKCTEPPSTSTIR